MLLSVCWLLCSVAHLGAVVHSHRLQARQPQPGLGGRQVPGSLLRHLRPRLGTYPDTDERRTHYALRG